MGLAPLPGQMHFRVAAPSAQHLVAHFVLGSHPRAEDVEPLARLALQGGDGLPTDQAPVGHHADLPDAERATQTIHHRYQGGDVGGVARPHLAAHWAPLTIEHQPRHHLLQIRPVVLAFPVLPQCHSALTLEVNRGRVEEHEREGAKQIPPAPEQLFLHQILGAPRSNRKAVLLLLQIPAYEWNFGDVNPPVHAWATIFTYRLEQAQKGGGDLKWLKSCFPKLLLNFTWWVNRKDRAGRNVFEGGFLGLDNIGLFDRSAALPTGGYLEQADGTAWMALYADNMAGDRHRAGDDRRGLGRHGPQVPAARRLDHLLVGAGRGGTGMWDEEDGFFYDVLRLPDGSAHRLKVRSMVGLLLLCAATPFELFAKYPRVMERFHWFMEARPELTASFHDPRKLDVGGRRLFSVLDEAKLRRVLSIMLDEQEFLSPYGIRPCRGTTPTTPTCSALAGRSIASATCPPNPTPRCSVATRTGAARSGCPSTC